MNYHSSDSRHPIIDRPFVSPPFQLPVMRPVTSNGAVPWRGDAVQVSKIAGFPVLNYTILEALEVQAIKVSGEIIKPLRKANNKE